MIEAIAGPNRADSVARAIGVGEWNARHASGAFGLTRPFAVTVLANRGRFWKREQLGLELSPGVDEASLALLVADLSVACRRVLPHSGAVVESRHGIRIVPDRSAASGEALRLQGAAGKPAIVLDDALRAIERRYGSAAAGVVAMQLEHPWTPVVR